ncbi:MAG: YbaK/EbsC family protein [Oscillospiraceae bacterium]|nr:YbaK/EbsC family protein [Oscillospiraceae bacterium]MDD4414782.1 YbaK/EbsC family protein [Oscillospiraceae bacterium]
MSVETVKKYFERFGRGCDVLEFDESSATVELAAKAVGVYYGQIAKTLCFKSGEGCILLVAAGDVKIDNTKFKAEFGFKASMLPPDDVKRLTGYAVGGVCPFALPEGSKVYADISLKKFDVVYPACGSSNSAIGLSINELNEYASIQSWVDVCKPYTNNI